MKHNKKYMIAGLAAGALILSVASAGVGAAISAVLRPDVTLELDGVKQTLVDDRGKEVSPILYNGSTYLPIRAVGNLLDLEVTWDRETQTVGLNHPEEKVPQEKPTETPETTPGESSVVTPPAKPVELWDRDAAFYGTELKKLDDRTEDLLHRCRSGEANLKLLYELENLDEALDRLEDAIEDSMKLNRTDRRTLLRDLDRTEDNLDLAEDLLEWAGLDDDLLDWDD